MKNITRISGVILLSLLAFGCADPRIEALGLEGRSESDPPGKITNTKWADKNQAYLSEGRYRIDFSISDMVFNVVLDFKMVADEPNRSYEVSIVDNVWGFNSGQIVSSGIEYGGKAMFVVPRNSINKIDAYYFWVRKKISNNELTGDGDVPFIGPNVGDNKFKFTMNKILTLKPE